jgi:multidrug transporter EmrE-like cation transporter
MLCANYLVCALLGAVYCGFRLVCPEVAGFSGTLGLGVLSGVLYLVSFVLFQWNTAKNGVVLSSVFMKLGLLVPIALSVVFFHEVPTWAQIAGFVIALAAIVVINGKSEGGAGRITVSDGTLRNLDLEMGVGQLNFTAALSGDSEFNLGVGESNITVLGDKENFNLVIEKGLGSVTLDGESVSNVKNYGNGNDHIEINGGVGSIRVDFKELNAA